MLLLVALLAGAWIVAPASLAAQSLHGSPHSMDIQDHEAAAHDFTFIRTVAQLERFVHLGYLVRLKGNADYRLDNEVSFPYARPEVKTFVRRLASEYRSACGRPLVVTSLTRPEDRQPPNASDRSVHPTGMAVDLHRSSSAACRRWLESTLLYLEDHHVVEATKEHYPPHYHVAVFPKPYARYVANMVTTGGADGATMDYQVRSGDSLWKIAKAMHVGIGELRTANHLRSDRIYPGQVLHVPLSSERMASSTRKYTVQSGDSLWEIARDNRVSVREIRQENGLRSNRIVPGQLLTLPVGG